MQFLPCCRLVEDVVGFAMYSMEIGVKESVVE